MSMQGTTESSFLRATRRRVRYFLYSLIRVTNEDIANSISWTLLELCRKPEIQRKLRNEIRAMTQVIRDRGDSAFSAADFDKMSYLTAVVKVVISYVFLPLIIDLSNRKVCDFTLWFIIWRGNPTKTMSCLFQTPLP